MIESVSHITFVVKNLEKTAHLFKYLFDAEEVYDSGTKIHSISKEKFFLIGGQWIVIMENDHIVNKTYHHLAFKIKESEITQFKSKINELNLETRTSRPRISGESDSLYFYDYDNNLFELHTGTLEERLAAYQKVDS